MPPFAPGYPPAGEEGGAIPWDRYRRALVRFKWLIAALTLLGGAAGYAAARRVVPQYEVYSTVWLASETPQSKEQGPIRAERLLNTSSWPELISSFAILDKVVLRSRLHIGVKAPAPRWLLDDLQTAETFRPGLYALTTDVAARTYEMRHGERLLERGKIGDSIGRAQGILWRPSPDSLLKYDSFSFTLLTPREAAIGVRGRLSARVTKESSLLRLTLVGSDPVQTTATLNALVHEFIETAIRLKARNMVEFGRTLEEQLGRAATDLVSAEAALESFRMATITLPSDQGTAAAGLQMTRDPVLRHYFEQKLTLDSIRTDREGLERVLGSVRRGEASVSALWSIPSIHAARGIGTAMTELDSKRAELRTAQQTYTDEHQTVRSLRRGIEELERVTIPGLASQVLEDLKRREAGLGASVAGASRELQQIPTRTIEETRLRRNVEAREELYRTLKSRYEEVRLAAAGSAPDLSILDYPITPQYPTHNPRRQILLVAVVFSFGLGIALAFLLDRLDSRFRYPDQASRELGLAVMGAVPKLSNKSANLNPETEWQLTEAFRSIRVGVTHAAMQGDQGKVTVAITSPGMGEGKSFVAANLALSFAHAGYRTVLIDGDVRRGVLHETFQLETRLGLTDYLRGQATMGDVLIPTGAEGLSLVASGSRLRHAPELLTARSMSELLTGLRDEYDVLIIDTAPLSAGVDAFVLGIWASQLLLVLRAGVTDRRLAAAKLETLGRFPIRLVGAVLNAVQATEGYEYYTYSDYGTAPRKRAPAPTLLGASAN